MFTEKISPYQPYLQFVFKCSNCQMVLALCVKKNFSKRSIDLKTRDLNGLLSNIVHTQTCRRVSYVYLIKIHSGVEKL